MIIIPFNPIHTSEYFAYLRTFFDCKDNAFSCFLKIYLAIFPVILKTSLHSGQTLPRGEGTRQAGAALGGTGAHEAPPLGAASAVLHPQRVEGVVWC